MEVSIEEKREISPLGGKLVNAILSNLQKAPFKVTLGGILIPRIFYICKITVKGVKDQLKKKDRPFGKL